MHERMLQVPGVSERINTEVIPVKFNTTDLGFPEELTGLGWWREQFHENPWTKMIYGHFVVMNGDGSRVYGTSGCQCVETMKYNDAFKFGHEQFDRAVDFFKRSRALEKIEKKTEKQVADLQEIHDRMNHHIHLGRVCGEDMRLLTARFLANHGAKEWKIVLGQLMPPGPGQNEADPLGERMRISAIRRLGEFVSDRTPFERDSAEHLEAIYRQAGAQQYAEIRARIIAEKGVDLVLPEEVPMPPSLMRLAAHSLGLIVGQDWKKDDPDLVAKAAAWWLEHEGEDRFQVSPVTLAKKTSAKR